MNKVLILKLFLICLFILCWFKMPWVYFQSVRSMGFLGFGYLAFLAYKNSRTNWLVFYSISALIIQPIFKVSLGRYYWNIMDLVWVIILLFSISVESDNDL